VKLILFLLKSSREIPYSRTTLIVVMASGIASGLINTAMLALINSSLHGAQSTRGMVWSFIGFCVALPIVRFISEVLQVQLASGALFEQRLRLSRKILDAPLRKLEEVGSPRLLVALTEDIAAISGALTTLPLLCMHCAIVIGCLIYLGWLSEWMLLGVFGFMILAVVTYQFAMTRAQYYFKKARESWDLLYKDFRALTEGTKELKLHRARREAFLSKVLSVNAQTLRQHNIYANAISNGARSWGQVLIFVFIGLLLFVVPGFSDISLETRMSYTLIILYLMTPVEVILNSVPGFGRAKIAVQKIEDLGLLLPSGVDSAHATRRKEIEESKWQTLELTGITHAYYRESEDDNFVLGPIDLKFNRGELVFLTGGNGSGKTTFAKLLTGLYIPESGEIRVDKNLVTDETRDDYRQIFSVVFSDFYLFETLLGLESVATDERAQDYLQQLHLNHKVTVVDGTLSTTSLSSGQRKRLALLTAYLEDRPFYVFDEWASDQDPLFKKIFYHQLLPELKSRNKTILVISHDEAYYHIADRVVKLNYGVVESDYRTSELRPVPEQVFELTKLA
jgi:putative pyoverdin transport system ATP-binding/permease protein